jgi:hypothetical protein
MIPFKYAGFYDVPRYIALKYQDRFLLLQSAFDDDLDDYVPNYSVYLLAESVEDSLREGNWDFINTVPMSKIGEIPVCTVVFDQSKRKEIDVSCFDHLITENLPLETS